MSVQNHDCSEELKNVNLKVTPARLAVMKLFESHNTPLDSAHLLDEHKELDIDRVTVFRILNSFVKAGLVRKLEFGEGRARYEIANEDHHHLICEMCGSIEDVSDCNIEALEKDIKQKMGFLVNSHSLEFYGLCTKCQLDTKSDSLIN